MPDGGTGGDIPPPSGTLNEVAISDSVPDGGEESPVPPSDILSELALNSLQDQSVSTSINSVRQLFKRLYDKTFLLPHNSDPHQLAILYKKGEELDTDLEPLLQKENSIPVIPLLPKKVSDLPRRVKRKKK